MGRAPQAGGEAGAGRASCSSVLPARVHCLGALLRPPTAPAPHPLLCRYCMNAAALKFVPDGEPLPPESQPAQQ